MDEKVNLIFPEDSDPGDRERVKELIKRTGLDPFTGMLTIIPVKREGGRTRVRAIVKIDGLRALAEQTGEYSGQIGPHWCGADGEWRDVWLEDSPPAAARVGVLRASFSEPVWGIATWRSFGSKAGGGAWARMPDVMLAKCAEAAALRKAFPVRLGGLLTDDEIERPRRERGQRPEREAPQKTSETKGAETPPEETPEEPAEETPPEPPQGPAEEAGPESPDDAVDEEDPGAARMRLAEKLVEMARLRGLELGCPGIVVMNGVLRQLSLEPIPPRSTIDRCIQHLSRDAAERFDEISKMISESRGVEDELF